MLPRNLLATLCVVLVLVSNPAFCANHDPQRFLANNPDPYKGLQLTCCLDKAPCGHKIKQRRVKDVTQVCYDAYLRNGYREVVTKDNKLVLVKKVGNQWLTMYPDFFTITCDNCQKETYETYNGQDTYTYQCQKGHDICLTCLRKKLSNLSEDAKKLPINIKNDNPNLSIGNTFKPRWINKRPSILRDPKLWIALLLVSVLIVVMYCLPMESSEKKVASKDVQGMQPKQANMPASPTQGVKKVSKARPARKKKSLNKGLRTSLGSQETRK